MREAFEQAILDNPNDLASYSAYSDWLQEQGDPRGEFIRVQLALEDESRPAPERSARYRPACTYRDKRSHWLSTD